MNKKVFAAAIFATIALTSIPIAANAVGYVPEANISVSIDPVPGGGGSIDFSEASFNPGETVEWTSTGDFAPTIGTLAVVTASGSKSAGTDGSLALSVGIPEGAVGTVSVVATGTESGNIGSASITVAPTGVGSGSGTSGGSSGGSGSDAGGSSQGALPNTGSSFPMLTLWIGAGILALGIAFIVVLRVSRRQRV